jgi:signal transduction histidine kinase
VSEQGRESMTERALRVGVVLVGLGYAVALFLGPARSQPTPGQAQFNQAYPEVLIGVVLVGAGIALTLVGGSRSVGLSAVLAGFAWLAIVPATLADGSDPLRGPGQAFAMLLAPALLGLIVALVASGRVSRRTIWSSALLLGLAALIAAMRLASYDPFADLTCVNCGHAGRPLLVATADQRLLLDRAATALTIASAVGLLWLGIASLWANSKPRGGKLAAIVGSGLVGIAVAGGLLVQSTRAALLPVSAGERDLDAVIELARNLGGGLLTIGLVWLVVDVVRVRVRMRQLAVDIATAAELGTLDVRLAHALNDQSLVVGYWLESEGHYVSRSGMPLESPPAGAERKVTIERRGHPIAAIWHRQGVEPSAISNELTPSLLVALDNERLQATGEANLRELRTSRSRLVAVQEAQRRQVERDLHDGIQQRLLAIVFELRLARVTAERSGDEQRSEWLARAETLSLALVEEIRRLAHGIHPAILSQAGLAAALSSLAEDSPIPMTVSVERSVRLTQTLETTVYQVIADALVDAVQAGAGELSVAVRLIDANVVVEVDHDATAAPVRVRLLDRIAAAGGSLSVEESNGGLGKRLRVALPCG